MRADPRCPRRDPAAGATTSDPAPSAGQATVTAAAEDDTVYAEQYVKAIDVEARLAVDMVKTKLYPATLAYLAELAGTAAKLKAVRANDLGRN